MAYHMRELEDLGAMQRREAVRREMFYAKPTFVERLLPRKLDFWRKPDISTDTVVTAHNPVLALLLLKQGLEMDMDFILTRDAGLDDWPYDLAMHPHTSMVIASSLGLSADRYGHKERFLSGLAEEFVAPMAPRVRRLPHGIALTAHARQHPGEIALTTKKVETRDSRDTEGETAWGVLASALSESPVIDLDVRKRRLVFARRAIVTGRADGFAPSTSDGSTIVYENQKVHAVGTAARVAVTNVQKAEMMVDDFLRCSRFEF